MNKSIETIKKTRHFVLDLVKDLTVDQLNEIPAGFNNNIIWNLAHLIGAQQGVCYVRAGLKPVVEESLFETYKPGTRPQAFVEGAETGKIKELFVTVIEHLETDYEKNIFSGYNAWTTRYGVELKNIDDALDFLIYHEGMHAGYVMALKRLVRK